MEIVGAIDNAPEKSGKDLGSVSGVNSLRRRRVFSTANELLEQEEPDLIIHAAVSRFRAAAAQLEPFVKRGISVVSSCEEMIFPHLSEPALALRFHKLCRHTGARAVGTGVNPGFVMDVLPIVLSGVCHSVREIHVQRVVNASTRREPLQRKIGSGMPPREFLRLFKAGRAGHAGLKESLALLAHSQGWRPTQIIETGAPVVADRNIQTAYFNVKRGQTCGLHQRAETRLDNGLRASLDLQMYLDADNPHDAIQIVGEPNLDLVLKGGVAGDHATVAALVNTAERIVRCVPGLLYLTDLPISAPTRWAALK